MSEGRGLHAAQVTQEMPGKEKGRGPSDPVQQRTGAVAEAGGSREEPDSWQTGQKNVCVRAE